MVSSEMAISGESGAMNTDVLIVGGGPTGLTLAIDLGKRGVRCTLIEQKARPAFLPKMERINARSMEIYRRLGLSQKIRAAGLRPDVPMDVYVMLALNEPPLLHLSYPSVEQAQKHVRASNDGSMPLEPYQLISQYTLEPLLKSVAETIPAIDVRFACEFLSLKQDPAGVTARLGKEYIVLVTSRFPKGGFPYFTPYWKPAPDGFDITLVDPPLYDVVTKSYANQHKTYLIDWIVVRK